MDTTPSCIENTMLTTASVLSHASGAGGPPQGDRLAQALLESRVVVVPGAMSWADIPATQVYVNLHHRHIYI